MDADPLPEHLQRQFDEAAFNGSLHIDSGRFDDAFRTFQQLYHSLLRAQPPGNRYHKGHPLHNAGYALVRLGKPQEALRYFLLAYIEDLLSQEPQDLDAADNAPAGTTLALAYQTPSDFFDRLKQLVRQHKERHLTTPDPQQILDEIAQTRKGPIQPLPELIQSRAEPSPPSHHVPGQFSMPWAKRVFVGGSYRDFAVLDSIKQLVKDNQFEPVLVDDFTIPSGYTHHHSLMLLHECRAAIFDVSSETGQVMEIERVRDYLIKDILIVYQTPRGESPRITEMLTTLLERTACKPQAYRTIHKDLRRLIRGFLQALPDID